MPLFNRFVLNVDLKRQLTAKDRSGGQITFAQAESAVLIFKVFDNGLPYDYTTATKAKIYIKTAGGHHIETDAEIVNFENGKAVRYEFEKIASVEVGFSQVILAIYEDDYVVNIQPFNVYIYDNLQGGSGSYLELIKDLMDIIEEMNLDLNNTIKLIEKGVPNGVATLDKDGKIPFVQMPTQIQNFLEHIKHTVFKDQVHGWVISEDGILQYTTPKGLQNAGFAPDALGNGGGNNVLNASVTVSNGVATVLYTGIPTVVAQKFAEDDRNLAYFTLNGNSFNGVNFNVSKLGLYTLWYKDSNGNTYTVLFNVKKESFEKPNIDIDVELGYVSITPPTSTTLTIKKWDKGIRDVSYFAYNGNTFTGNTFQVTEVGTYTIYVKTSQGLEYVYEFEVTDSMLPPPLIDTTPPELNVYLTGDYLSIKVGAVKAYVSTKDEVGGSGVSYITLPDGTKDYTNFSFREYLIKSNGTKSFKSTDVSGNTSTVNKTINNIGTPVKISSLALGSKFSFCDGNYIILEKQGDRCLIAEQEATNYGAFADPFDVTGTTNLFSNASIKNLINNRSISGTLNEEYEILSNGRWNYGKVTENGGLWLHSTNEYTESFAGLLTVPQLVNAYEKKWFTQEYTSELSITPVSNISNGVHTVEKNSSGYINVNNKLVSFSSNYRIAYYVSNNAIGYI